MEILKYNILYCKKFKKLQKKIYKFLLKIHKNQEIIWIHKIKKHQTLRHLKNIKNNKMKI